jgi:hypothetical protein
MNEMRNAIQAAPDMSDIGPTQKTKMAAKKGRDDDDDNWGDTGALLE